MTSKMLRHFFSDVKILEYFSRSKEGKKVQGSHLKKNHAELLFSHLFKFKLCEQT